MFWLRWVFVAARGLSLVAARGATLCCSAQASHVAVCGLSSCGARALLFRSMWDLHGFEPSSGKIPRALLFRSMWDLPGGGLEPMSPEMAGGFLAVGFLTTAPPGKPKHIVLI